MVCPHCGVYCEPPNIRAAKRPDESEALRQRYQAAIAEAEARGDGTRLKDFETALLTSKAVISRSLHETLRLAGSEHEVYSTYYKLMEAQTRLPKGETWDALRTSADAALFTNYARELRFAALTLNEEGLSNYGLCSWLLRTDMIADRTSVMDENSTMFAKHHDIRLGDADKIPKGYRAIWGERARIGVAKLGVRIDAHTDPEEYSTLLLKQGMGSEDDDFIEAQIFGPLTIRTIERITVNSRASKQERAILKGLKEKLKEFSVGVK
jgi:hypothetical protein